MGSEETDGWRIQFSLFSLAMLVTSMAVVFGGTRAFGAFGFVFGCFLTMIALGQMVGRQNWMLGGATGAVVLPSILLGGWLLFGNLDHMDYRYVGDVNDRFDAVQHWLADSHEKHGAYPARLSDLQASNDVVAYEMYTGAEAELWFDYEKTNYGFRLTYLGTDQKTGGTGRDADISPQEVAGLKDKRVSFRAFLSETPGSGGLNLTLILSLIVAFAVVGGLPSERDKRVAGVVAVISVTVGATVIGIFLAGLHIAVSQSGH